MKKTALAIGTAASICLVGTAAPAALAHTHAPQAKSHLHASASPTKPSVGQTVIVKGSGALKSTQYYCILALDGGGINLQKGGAAIAYTPSITTVTSTSSGKISCKQIFFKFSGTWKGKKHYCPPTKADKKAGYGCGVGLADVKTRGKTSKTVAKFKF